MVQFKYAYFPLATLAYFRYRLFRIVQSKKWVLKRNNYQHPFRLQINLYLFL